LPKTRKMRRADEPTAAASKNSKSVNHHLFDNHLLNSTNRQEQQSINNAESDESIHRRATDAAFGIKRLCLTASANSSRSFTFCRTIIFPIPEFSQRSTSRLRGRGMAPYGSCLYYPSVFECAMALDCQRKPNGQRRT
jgi:hypothetical protein